MSIQLLWESSRRRWYSDSSSSGASVGSPLCSSHTICPTCSRSRIALSSYVLGGASAHTCAARPLPTRLLQQSLAVVHLAAWSWHDHGNDPAERASPRHRTRFHCGLVGCLYSATLGS